VYQGLDLPVAERRRQRKAGQARAVRTSQVMSEINADNNKHRKDLQYEENSNDGSNNLFIVSRAAVVRCSTALLICSDTLTRAYCNAQVYPLLP
jgi:hypothetical protein